MISPLSFYGFHFLFNPLSRLTTMEFYSIGTLIPELIVDLVSGIY